MDTKQLGVLAFAALTSCTGRTDQRQHTAERGMTLAQCRGSLHSLTASPLLAPFKTATIVGKPKCITIGSPGHGYAAAAITYDFSTISPAYLQTMHLNPGDADVIFFVIQQAPSPPMYQVLLSSTQVRVTASGPNGGDITVSPALGSNVNVHARLAIVDGLYAPADSKYYWWNSTDPTQSLGAALVGSANCAGGSATTVATCPGAKPPAWPFAGYPRAVLNANGHNWLAFTFPTVGSNTYEYWLRAFTHGAIYDIDPRIINQPV